MSPEEAERKHVRPGEQVQRIFHNRSERNGFDVNKNASDDKAGEN